MELSTSKSELSKALSITQSIVERKTTMPILSNVLLSTTDGNLQISATDFESTVLVKVRAKVKSSGSTTINARVLTDLIRELPEGEIHIKLSDGERLDISSGNSKFKIIGVSAEEYPSLPGLAAEAHGKVSSQQFLEMVNKTIYAVSQDETRFNLNGICFESCQDGKKNSALRMVATDGHRLAMITRQIDGLSFNERVIVPRKGMAEIRRILDGDSDKTVGVDVTDGFFVIKTDECKFSIRLIDGEFPDYNQVVPKKKGVQMAVQSDKLAQAMKRMSLMVSDKEKCVRLDLSTGRLRISSSSPELGEAREELEIKYEGEPLSVGFNARYLIDVSSSLSEGETLIIELNGELGAARCYPESDESYMAIVMPMRLNQGAE